ncbi:patatin-like phospholipase, putative [Plasmodium malariae]|uniref:Patatin-like phospholipase, putative n=1 Tax=Plasmodium malariae TaxID=5858 RepID=A0A1C3KBR8_PLAMA|nr:patatin-like phospholipase, putative [Plasmodium malariae]
MHTLLCVKHRSLCSCIHVLLYTMKTPEFSLDSLKKQRKKKKRRFNYENFSAHYFLKLPIFIILMIVFFLNTFIYLLIRFLIFFFENASFFIMTQYIDLRRCITRKRSTRGKSGPKQTGRRSRKRINNLRSKIDENGKEEGDMEADIDADVQEEFEEVDEESEEEVEVEVDTEEDYHEKSESIYKIDRLMRTCNSYSDYVKYAYQMDILTGKTIHINENYDYINIYDVNLLKKISQSIKKNLLNNDVLLLVEDIKIATSPRIKGIFQEKYYCKTYSTPHIIVTDFINNIMNGLNYIENYVKEKKEKNNNYLYCDEYLLIKKYFEDIFRQWGNTALFLSGGAILGLHHFGVLEVFLKSSINIDYFNDFTKGVLKEKRNNTTNENNKKSSNSTGTGSSCYCSSRKNASSKSNQGKHTREKGSKINDKKSKLYMRKMHSKNCEMKSSGCAGSTGRSDIRSEKFNENCNKMEKIKNFFCIHRSSNECTPLYKRLSFFSRDNVKLEQSNSCGKYAPPFGHSVRSDSSSVHNINSTNDGRKTHDNINAQGMRIEKDTGKIISKTSGKTDVKKSKDKSNDAKKSRGEYFSKHGKIDKTIFSKNKENSTNTTTSAKNTNSANNVNNFVENFEDNILPQIICGTSAGSIIAAWICSRTNSELLEEFNMEFIYNIVSCFSSENWFYSFFNIYKKGNFYDIDKIIKIVYNLYGDITFLEAFIKTNLVLNITVTRAESGSTNFSCDEDGHIVLNYMNSPNVLIYTAVLASCSFPYLLQPFKLLEKKYNNENVYRFMSIKQVYNTKLIMNSNDQIDHGIDLQSQEDGFLGKEEENEKEKSEKGNDEKRDKSPRCTQNEGKNETANLDVLKYKCRNKCDKLENSNFKQTGENKHSSCTTKDVNVKEEDTLSKKISVKTVIGKAFNRLNKEYLFNNNEEKKIRAQNDEKEDCKNEENIKKQKKIKKNNDNDNDDDNDYDNDNDSGTFSEQKVMNSSEKKNFQIYGSSKLQINNFKIGRIKEDEKSVTNEIYKKEKKNKYVNFNEYKKVNLLDEEYTIINSVQFKNMYFHDGSLKSDIPAHNLNQILSVKYKIVSQVNPHVFPFTGIRVHGEAGKPVKCWGNSGHWRAGFLMSSMEILFKENIRYILRLMALLDLSPTIRGMNAGSIAMQNYKGDVTLHPKRLYLKHFKLISVSKYDDVEWYTQEGRQMTFQKLPLILNRMKIEKKLVKMKKFFK